MRVTARQRRHVPRRRAASFKLLPESYVSRTHWIQRGLRDVSKPPYPTSPTRPTPRALYLLSQNPSILLPQHNTNHRLHKFLFLLQSTVKPRHHKHNPTMGRSLAWWLLVMSLISSRLIVLDAVWLNLPSSGTKCVSEEIQNHVVVVGDYVVIDESGHGSPTVSAKVTSPYGNTVYHQENVTNGQFAFTTTEMGSYVACFWTDGNHQSATLNVDWKTGIAAKDWDAVAKKEHIEGVELELRKLEGAVDAIRENLIYLKKREAEMREVSETTNARVAWFSIMSLAVGIIAALFQVWFLKHYFQKKKLI